jgi:hypothetical protein
VSSAASGAYRVWLASVPRQESVDPEWRRLRAKYATTIGRLDLVVQHFEDKARGTTSYRIMAGAFPTQQAAEEICQAIRTADPTARCLVQRY